MINKINTCKDFYELENLVIQYLKSIGKYEGEINEPYVDIIKDDKFLQAAENKWFEFIEDNNGRTE